MKNIEYFIKYKWYGYEGVGHCDSQHTDECIDEVIKFKEFAEFCLSKKVNDKYHNEYFRDGCEKYFLDRFPNGYITSIDTNIYKRTIIQEMADVKKESRNNNIEKIITDMKNT
jgi:hypothetical protein